MKELNPNEAAKAEIAKMPSLAGKPPRTAFHENMVVMADLVGRGYRWPSNEPLKRGFDMLESK